MSDEDRILVIERLISAPRERVWKAWTDPDEIAKWWGPDGFTNTVLEMEVMPGGRWRFIMHGPDGKDYDNKVVYTEVKKPSRLVYVHGSDQHKDDEAFHVVTTFEEVGKKTKVTLRMTMKSAEQLERIKRFGAVEGGNQTLARLDKFVGGTK